MAKQLDLTNYPDIECLDELFKSGNLWTAMGHKHGYYTSAEGKTKRDALSNLNHHLSYVTAPKY